MTQTIKLKLIGIDEVIVGNAHDVLGTTLGSCVAIALWDSRLKTGGLNHYLLPDNIRSLYQKGHAEGHMIIESLIKEVLSQGSLVKDLLAVVVGGSESIFDNYHIGAQNLQVATDLLSQYGIKVLAVSGGGYYSRHVRFYVGEGKVVVKKIALSKVFNESEEVILMGGNR